MYKFIDKEMIQAIRQDLKNTYGDCLQFRVRGRRDKEVEVTIMRGTVDFSDFLKRSVRAFIFEGADSQDQYKYRNNDLIKDILQTIKAAPGRAQEHDGYMQFDISLRIGGISGYERLPVMPRTKSAAAFEQEDPHRVAKRFAETGKERTQSISR